METPASMRRVTRSQSAALLQKSKTQEEAKRLPLFNITNDSPINGLKTEKTPINNSSKKDDNTDKRAPQSGQSLLRTQAKTLLQIFEDEKEDSIISQKVVSTLSEQDTQSNHALIFEFDSPGESEVTYDGSTKSSVWSMQVNASSEKGEEIEEIFQEEIFQEDYEEEYYYECEEEEEGDFFDEICKGMNKMCIMDETEKGGNVNLPEFRGTRTKFVYNSEDEIEDEVTILRGLPVPEGTHLRFHDEDDE